MADFAEWLRGRSDAELMTLLRHRPDLMTPVPTDVAALAGRAAGRASVGRALDRLDRFSLQVVEALLVAPTPTTYDELRAMLRADADPRVDPALRAAVTRLRELALVFGDDTRLRPVAALRELITAPAGLGPPARHLLAGHPPERLATLHADLGLAGDRPPLDAIAAALADPDRLTALLADAGPAARAALDRLAYGPPTGSVAAARRHVRVTDATSPVERLLARGLLVASGERAVTLPREVALFLRGGRLFREVAAVPPALAGPSRPAESVARVAGGSALRAIRVVEDMLTRWGMAPPAVLRSGGLGVRELRRAAESLEVEEWAAVVYVELAHAAGLLAATGAVEGEWLPTSSFDTWRARPPEERWVALATAWLATTRVAGLVGRRDERGKPRNALGPDLDRAAAPEIRAQVLAALAEASGAVGAADVREWLSWRLPRRTGPLVDLLVDTTLREAELLGVTGRGVLAPAGHALLADDIAEATRLAAEALPTPVDQVVIQADLTAIAPGPVTAELGRELALAADVESSGGATVYRFSASSVRRALDAGRGASELLDFLSRHSTTPLPQPLRYLIEDVARRHGRVRVGTATSYLRCDDPATVDELLADRRTADLGLTRLAATVVVSRVPRETLLDALRALGHAPVAESPGGGVLVTRSEGRRTRLERLNHANHVARAVDDTMIAAAVRALRAGEEAAAALRRAVPPPDTEPPRSTASATAQALREAAAAGRRVWIGYLDADGQASSRIVEPARVAGGFLTAYDATRAALHRFALYRITGVAELDERAPSP